MQFKIAAFYEFNYISDLELLSKSLKLFCKRKKLMGSVIIASEGINGTIAGFPSFIDEFIDQLAQLGFHHLNIKYSQSATMPFYRSKVKIKKEIVTFHEKPINFKTNRAEAIKAKNWNNFVNQTDVITIDVRNEYEVKIGSFKNSISPKTKSFVEFKDYVEKELLANKDQKFAMYCTGGIRCEKASSYMKNIGFNNVFQLDGGILKYLEEIDDKDSLWDGECFVFDNRVTLTKDLVKGTYDLCRGCNEPISQYDQKSQKFEKDVSCPTCYDTVSEEKKSRSRERSKQIKLSKQRGIPNIYLPQSVEDHVEGYNKRKNLDD